MKIETRNFGPMDIDTEQVVRFLQPLYGFEEERDFVALSDSDIGDCFLWLQSTVNRDVCFVLVDPAVLAQPYAPKLPAEVARLLKIDNPLDVIVRLVAVVPEKFTDATVNLKSPVIINTVRRCAAQIMLDEDYPVRAPLVAAV